MKTDILVVGAGFSGSVVAERLASHGFDVLVVDLDDRPLVMLATWTRGTPPAEVDALLGVVDSIELVPPDRS